MLGEEKLRDETLRRFERVVNRVHVLERSFTDPRTGEPLYTAQLNAVAAVGDSPRLSVTELSDRLGVTRASASEMARKLETKGHLRRGKNPGDGRGVSLELTAKGQSVRKRQETLRKEMLSTYFQDITFGEVAIFNEILAKIEALVDVWAKEEAESS